MTSSGSDTKLVRSVVFTFPLAFALHDLEEVLTAARWSETAVARLAERKLRLARLLDRALPVSTTEMALAVGVLGVAVGGGTIASLRRPDGDLYVTKVALAAFSAHALGHLGASTLFARLHPGFGDGAAANPRNICRPSSVGAASRMA
jgi:hypothetical protein